MARSLSWDRYRDRMRCMHGVPVNGSEDDAGHRMPPPRRLSRSEQRDELREEWRNRQRRTFAAEMRRVHGAPDDCELDPLDCAKLATSIYSFGNEPPRWILSAAIAWCTSNGFTAEHLRPSNLALRTNDRGGTSGQDARSACGPGNAAVAQTYLRREVLPQERTPPGTTASPGSRTIARGSVAR